MNRKNAIVSSILWAAAIIASAANGAPSILTMIILPGLAATFLLVTTPRSKTRKCVRK
ncbi:hypothetical protein [Undibacterium sp. TJN19]|uniref:hypothetical protein n=1 Tax=Undibacterium sp. TJN19 TaxID=3413055 RepID=UPI003BF2A0AB